MGLNAHSDMDGRRFYNPGNWEDYLAMAESDMSLREQEGSSAQDDRMFERMMMGLRQTRGVDAERFERDFGMKITEVWPKTIARMTDSNLMDTNKERIFLTERGMQVMNGILVSLMEEKDPE